MQLSPQDTALLLIDVQVGLVNEPLFNKDGFLDTVQSLLADARAADVPVIYMQDKDVGGVGTPEWAIHPAVAPQSGDTVIRKPEADSFFETDLQDTLVAKGIKTLVVAGLKTEMCVDTTCRRAYELGYKVILASDAHSSTDRDYIKAEQIIRHHNFLLACVGTEALYIDVLPAEDIQFG